MPILSRIFNARQATPGFSTSIALGDYGEKLALEFLKTKAYRIVATNFIAPLGRSRNGRLLTGEIDIIAYDEENVLCFIEVKTRRSQDYAAPEAAVNSRKQRQIIRTARVYRRLLRLQKETVRYDVVTVLLEGKEPELNLLRSYFHAERFQRSRQQKPY